MTLRNCRRAIFLAGRRTSTIKQILLVGAYGRVFSPTDEFLVHAVWKILGGCR